MNGPARPAGESAGAKPHVLPELPRDTWEKIVRLVLMVHYQRIGATGCPGAFGLSVDFEVGECSALEHVGEIVGLAQLPVGDGS